MQIRRSSYDRLVLQLRILGAFSARACNLQYVLETPFADVGIANQFSLMSSRRLHILLHRGKEDMETCLDKHICRGCRALRCTYSLAGRLQGI